MMRVQAMLGVAVVAEIWALDDKAPIAAAVDANWQTGLRQVTSPPCTSLQHHRHKQSVHTRLPVS